LVNIFVYFDNEIAQNITLIITQTQLAAHARTHTHTHTHTHTYTLIFWNGVGYLY